MQFVSAAIFTIFCSIFHEPVYASKCGCKVLSSCYRNMLDILHEQDEAYCIEDASIGTSTLTIFLHALKEFCGDRVTVVTGSTTFDHRNLYEVVVHINKSKEEQPTIIIDAGQEAGEDSVEFALFIIEQLVACRENREMIEKVKWVIMPSTNPDGLEFSRYRHNEWRKNLKVNEEEISFGVDISRNFDEHWGACDKINTGFASNYPGPMPASENETVFIKNVVNKHIKNAKIYLSIRRNGHHIGFPNAYSSQAAMKKEQLEMIAAEVAHKVNLRSAGIHSFKNDSIYNLEAKERCGHSVDWVSVSGISWAFEMRVYLENDNEIMSMFQTMPRGYDNTLRNGYFTGIRELYNVLTNKKKYGKLTE